ncbi:MAG: hypothetical protein HYV03_00540 [Deltaproteobacteria bacterium]|nr:hypothetical protein [Deltaproteobacteria bacterium]
MQRFSAQEMATFLRAMDRYVQAPYTLIVIGGAAAALAYGAIDVTRDIDTMNDPAPIMPAYEAAKRATGLNIPLGPAGVADAPYEYEARLRRLGHPRLRKLTILVPERHDLVLMKVVRGYEHDLAAIEGIARNFPIKYDVLLQRFCSEMTHVVGRPETLRLNFLAAIERLFGEAKADETARRLPVTGR